MGLEMDATMSLEGSEILYARSQNRQIEVELEPITKQATRIRVTARGSSLIYDNATAVEIVQQTGKVLDAAEMAKAAPATAATGGSVAPALPANSKL
jgi:hypothetical protein